MLHLFTPARFVALQWLEHRTRERKCNTAQSGDIFLSMSHDHMLAGNYGRRRLNSSIDLVSSSAELWLLSIICLYFNGIFTRQRKGLKRLFYTVNLICRCREVSGQAFQSERMNVKHNCVCGEARFDWRNNAR